MYFGHHVEQDFLIKELITRMPRLSGVDFKIVALELYETIYGIYKHIGNTKRPMASVAFHDCEDYTTDSLLEAAMDTFITKSIKELFGLSFPEYLELPHDVVMSLGEIGLKHIQRKDSDINRIKAELEGTK